VDLPTDADPRRVRLAELNSEIRELETKRVEAHELEQELAEDNPNPFRSAPVRQ
jgi:Fe-S-cluster formation regulator IscX/YfhJ